VYLVDAHVYVFRSYHALPPMHAPDGSLVHAAHGFTGTLLRMLGDLRPTHFACVFDHAMTSFRNELWPTYKEGRTEAPADLDPQFDLCEEAARALGVPLLLVPDFEADDAIATAADAIVASDADAVVVTSDKDLSQLVREDGRVTLLDFAKGQRLDADGVRQRFGVSPAQIPDYLALVGDAVDNLPGVPGIGPKTAAQLLAGFATLDAIPTAIESWRALGVRGADALAERFAAHRDRALVVRELARLRHDAPGADLALDALVWRGPDRERSVELFGRLGWKGIAKRVAALSTGPQADTSS
jgi:5'-3' exonuclease